MIHDSLSHSEKYLKLNPHFAAAFAWLNNFDPKTEDGKYPINGSDCVAGVQRYITKKSSEKKWEAHRVFGDIQVVFQGEEVCGHTDVKKLQSAEAYSHEKDVEKFTAPDFTASKLVLRKGTFTIFYPGDAHQPGVILNEPTAVLKVVIKFKL